jgi:two-component system heavy metal sensor histidine kinase CusS
LGLALVKSIVDLHGGSVRIESEVNRGATVTFVFPNTRAA